MPPREAKNKKQRERDEEKKSRDAGLDHTIEESFPASDPPSSIPDPLDADAVPEPRKSDEDEVQ